MTRAEKILSIIWESVVFLFRALANIMGVLAIFAMGAAVGLFGGSNDE